MASKREAGARIEAAFNEAFNLLARLGNAPKDDGKGTETALETTRWLYALEDLIFHPEYPLKPSEIGEFVKEWLQSDSPWFPKPNEVRASIVRRREESWVTMSVIVQHGGGILPDIVAIRKCPPEFADKVAKELAGLQAPALPEPSIGDDEREERKSRLRLVSGGGDDAAGLVDMALEAGD